MRDFTIELTHRPGELERVCDALARTGVNLRSLTALESDLIELAIAVDNVKKAKKVLE
jgi:hypothetical protein